MQNSNQVNALLQIIDRFNDAGQTSAPARTIHDAIHYVSEAIRSNEMDVNPGLELIHSLSEIQVFITEVLEQRAAIKDLAQA